MYTPAHIAASVLVWRNEPGWSAASAVTIGALLPDLPMMGFYCYQRVAGSSESQIWSKLYYEDSWQLFFDVFNSIPLLLAVLAISYACGFRWGMLLAASALLHCVCDFPLHHDDAHRHFLPVSNWRFASPVSYWDPRRYGLLATCFEQAFALAACVYVGWWGRHFPMKSIAAGTLTLYVVAIGLAMLVWLPQLVHTAQELRD